MEQITAEQQIANLIRALKEATYRPFYKGQLDDLRSMIDSLQAEFERYRRGELQPLPVKDDPFAKDREG